MALAIATASSWGAQLYVWQNSPAPVSPYGDWASAAHTIQEAVDAAAGGDTVVVTNGVYGSGGRAVAGLMTNRVVIDKAITVQSVNGPAGTVICGAAAPAGGNGEGAIRCAYVGANAVLSGFTLTNGHTRSTYSANFETERTGGGMWCENSATVSNCIIISNLAQSGGGGVKGGMLYDCIMSGNVAAHGGGAWSNTLYRCILKGNTATEGRGGGAVYAQLYDCTVADNTSDEYGGGADQSVLFSCKVMGNTSAWGGGVSGGTIYNSILSSNSAAGGGGGGGVFGSTLYNCTLTGNRALMPSIGGGAWGGCVLSNCIVQNNFTEVPVPWSNYYGCVFSFSCTTPLPGEGLGNIDADPAFVDAAAGDFRLRYGSPCIDAGTDFSGIISNDFAGSQRPLDGNADGNAAFDIGAYEYNPQTSDSNADGIPDFWCLRYGLSPAASGVATNNPDGDAFTTFEEWQADTDPTNALAYFRIESITPGPPVQISFLSSASRCYSLVCSSNLASTSWLQAPDQIKAGTGGPQTLVDTNTSSGRFYRVRVSLP